MPDANSYIVLFALRLSGSLVLNADTGTCNRQLYVYNLTRLRLEP